jgi:hypothetical protein
MEKKLNIKIFLAIYLQKIEKKKLGLELGLWCLMPHSTIFQGCPYKRSITVVLIIFIINVVIFDLYSAVHRNVLINYPLQEKPSLL